MSSWNKFKLRELCTLEKKLIKPEEDIEYIHYSLPAFDNNKVPEIQFGKEIKSSKFKVEKGCILFNKLNLRFKRVWNINYDIKTNSICSTEFLPLKPKENILSDFLYYLLIEPNFTESMLVSASGTSNSHQRISPNHLMDYEFLIPDIEKQEEIVNCLSHLDYKIELNIQINQTLEQIAQAIFKSWFIDFDPVKAKAEAKAQGSTDEQANIAAMSVISGKSPDQLNAYKQTNPTDYQQLHQLAQAFPSELEEIDGVEVPKGWGIETLSEISSMRNGYAFKSNEWAEEGIPVIKIGSIKPMIVEVEGNGFVSEENKSSRPDFVVKEGDILVGLTGYVGEVGRIPQHKIAMLNQRVAKFIPNKIDNKYTFYNFIYCAVRNNKFKEYATINAKGSAQANISTNELLKYPIIKATDNIHISFEKYVGNILDKVLKNSGENEFLEKARDLLLPKLLSGEVGV